MGTKIVILTILLIALLGLIRPANASEPEYKWFREWQDRAEIKAWVMGTGINDKEYIPEVYDCDDIAVELMFKGLEQQRFIGILYVKTNQENHWANFTMLGEEIIRIDALRYWNDEKLRPQLRNMTSLDVIPNSVNIYQQQPSGIRRFE